MDAPRKADLERLAGLTHAGAVRAAAAFAQLLGSPVSARQPVVCERGTGSLGRSERAREDAGTIGVFFEFEGCVDALVGMLFPADASDALVRHVVGIESGLLDPAIVESALMEVGNILASHVASGIADALHSRLLPSIPALSSEHAEREFAAWVENVAGSDAAHLESTLCTPDGTPVGRLVVVPVDGTGQSNDRAAPSTEPVC